MSKYGQLSRTDGHSKWFLQRTLTEHDRTMDHPWMQMIYKQCFTVKQYATWLALNHAVFQAMEQNTTRETMSQVYDEKLFRTAPLETDLAQLLGSDWRKEAVEMVNASPATKKHLAQLEADSSNPLSLLAHHFLQYNAVLSGGSYLGKMVSEKLCVVHGAPGVAFYAFADVQNGMESARVQRYLRDFDKVEMSEEERDSMLAVMQRVYADTEVMMQECFDINPVEGLKYSAAQDGVAAEPPPPCPEQLELSLSELHGYTGADEGRILFSIAGELLDVSAGRELYGPGCGYSLLAGRDVTRCLATMSLETSELDDLKWEPDNAEEEKALAQWREKLKAKYPVAGTLDKTKQPAPDAEGLRQRTPAAASSAQAAPAAGADGQKCPISGKEGTCPMTMMGINIKPKAKANAASDKPEAKTGFMAGKSLIAAVQESKGESSDDWWLWKLCPLHWDDQTTKAFSIVALLSWLSGIFIGWNLHKALR